MYKMQQHITIFSGEHEIHLCHVNLNFFKAVHDDVIFSHEDSNLRNT